MRTSPIQFHVELNDPELGRPQPSTSNYKSSTPTVEEVIEGHTFTIDVHTGLESKRHRYGFCKANLYTDPDGHYTIKFVGEYHNLVRLRKTIPTVLAAINDMGVEYWYQRAEITGWYTVSVEINQVPLVCEDGRASLMFFACSEYERAAQYKGWYVVGYERHHEYHAGMGEDFQKFLEKHDVITGYDDSPQYYYCFKDLSIESLVSRFKLSMVIDMHERLALRKIRKFERKLFKDVKADIFKDVGELL